METIVSWLGIPLGKIMEIAYSLCRNYGLAIILFTLVSKFIMLPIGVWVHRNSIKVVKLQPEINELKVRCWGDPDRLAEEQGKLYKREKYNPLASLIPLFIQILLLMGLVEVIYHPLTYLFHLTGDQLGVLTEQLAALTGADAGSASVQLRILEAMKNPEYTGAFQALSMPGTADWPALMQQIVSLNTRFLGVDLCHVPLEHFSALWFVPLVTGFSAWLLCYAQNRANVLQSEQGAWNKYGTMALSVGLSLYLGAFVPAGLAVYWTCGNLLAILQLLILNTVISPAKYVDYEALENSKKKLYELEHLGNAETSREEQRSLAKRENADYKRFFSVANKHIVFYSEQNGFYKYFEAIIRELLLRTNLTIHYVTSDPKDDIFSMAESNSRIKAYYIGEKKLITLFMKMDAQMVIMTMSDLDNYHYKRSYVRKDIEYVYVFHYPLSTHMVLHTGALDHYDTILCVGDFQFDEIRKQEELYNLPQKKLIACGYGQLEKLYDSYTKMEKTAGRTRRKVLIAPSWQQDNILDSCIDDLLHELLGHGFDVTVRPHPEYVKRYKPRMDEIINRYAGYDGGDLFFETDFTSNQSIYDSDVVISDWSGTAYEFSLVTLKPCVFVDTPPKINNPDYVNLGIEPLEFSLRDQIGIRVDPADMANLAGRLQELFDHSEDQAEKIRGIRDRYISNFGSSGYVAEQYIVSSLKEHTAGKQTVRNK